MWRSQIGQHVCTWKSDLCTWRESSHCRMCEDCDLVSLQTVFYPLLCSDRDRTACPTPHHLWTLSFPFTSRPKSFSFVTVPLSCTLLFFFFFTFHLLSPFYTIAPYFHSDIVIHWLLNTIVSRDVFFCSFLVWYEMYLYGKIYMQYVRMLWAKQAHTYLFFVNEQAYEFDWVTKSIKNLYLKCKHDRLSVFVTLSEKSHCQSPCGYTGLLYWHITGLCYKHRQHRC